MDDSIYLLSSYIFLSIFFYFLGWYRRNNDLERIDKILVESHTIMKQNIIAVINAFKDELQNMNSKNSELIIQQNVEAIELINNQTHKLNSNHQTLLNMNKILLEQSNLYERIVMLQKIIVKKKKAEK